MIKQSKNRLAREIVDLSARAASQNNRVRRALALVSQYAKDGKNWRNPRYKFSDNLAYDARQNGVPSKIIDAFKKKVDAATPEQLERMSRNGTSILNQQRAEQARIADLQKLWLENKAYVKSDGLLAGETRDYKGRPVSVLTGNLLPFRQDAKQLVLLNEGPLHARASKALPYRVTANDIRDITPLPGNSGYNAIPSKDAMELRNRLLPDSWHDWWELANDHGKNTNKYMEQATGKLYGVLNMYGHPVTVRGTEPNGVAYSTSNIVGHNNGGVASNKGFVQVGGNQGKSWPNYNAWHDSQPQPVLEHELGHLWWRFAPAYMRNSMAYKLANELRTAGRNGYGSPTTDILHEISATYALPSLRGNRSAALRGTFSNSGIDYGNLLRAISGKQLQAIPGYQQASPAMRESMNHALMNYGYRSPGQ